MDGPAIATLFVIVYILLFAVASCDIANATPTTDPGSPAAGSNGAAIHPPVQRGGADRLPPVQA